MQNAIHSRHIASVLERRGMEFAIQKPSKRVDTSRPSTAASQSRPLSMRSSSPYFEQAVLQSARQNPFTLPTIEAGSLSSNRPATAVRPTLQLDGPLGRPESQSQAMPPPRLFTRDEAVLPRTIKPNRPTTAQMFRSHTTPYHNSQIDSSESGLQTANTAVERPSLSSQLVELEAIRQAASDYESPPQMASADVSEPVASGLPIPNYGPLSDAAKSNNSIAPSLDAANTTLRLSTPFTIVMPDTLEHEIPPRRELPFVRPSTAHSGNDKATSRPTSSSLALPPLPKPKSVKRGTSPTKSDGTSPMKANGASPSKHSLQGPRPDTASPLKRSFDAFSESPQRCGSASGALRTADINVSPSKTSAKLSPVASPEKLSPMNELLARSKPLSERSPNSKAPRLDSLADAPYEFVSPPGTATSPAKRPTNYAAPEATTLPATEDDYVARTYNALATSVSHQSRASLDDYAAQSRADREAAIDEFMVAHLENPAFTKLCEDVENCWRRFALGL